MEQQSWLDALASANNKIETLERAMMQHTTAIVKVEKAQEQLGQQHQTFSTALSKLTSQLDQTSKIINEKIVSIDQNFKTVGELLQSTSRN